MNVNSTNYDFPCIAFDFGKSQEVAFDSYTELELYIRNQLKSADKKVVKDGLSNVLYWVYATSKGRQGHRVNAFRNQVNEEQLNNFSKLVLNEKVGISEVKKCKLPQFSNLSFITKILMFLDPERYVVMDLQLAKIKEYFPESFFSKLVVYKTSLPANQLNEAFYDNWCNFCRDAASRNNLGKNRAVDVERYIFQLVRSKKIADLKVFFDHA